jgi:peptidoglycan/xylan/chitin deacetylase (PgdA/CDA1 family)
VPIHTARRVIREQLASTGAFEQIVQRRTFAGVLVLCYHAIRPDRQPDGVMPFEGIHVRRALFREHCRVLSRLCHPISFAQWRDSGRNRADLPQRPVLLTFDDGYRSMLTEAVPVLEEFGVPAVLFACSDPIARGEMFWYDAVAAAKGEDAVTTVKASVYSEWRTAYERVRQPVSADAPAAPLSPAEIERLAAHPLIEIGGHSHRHPVMARAGEHEQCEEVIENLDALQQWTGARPEVFAYPGGQRGTDYTAATERCLTDTGVQVAFATGEGMARFDQKPLSRPRFVMTAGLTSAHLLHRLAWLWR